MRARHLIKHRRFQAARRAYSRGTAPRLRWGASTTVGREPLENRLNITAHIGPVAALVAGILILLVPRLLNYIVAIYLIVIGAVGLFG